MPIFVDYFMLFGNLTVGFISIYVYVCVYVCMCMYIHFVPLWRRY